MAALSSGSPRPACSGGTSGCCRPRWRPRRCIRAWGSRAHPHRSRSPDARRPSGPSPWRRRREWRTRRWHRCGRRPCARSEELRRSWSPWSQTANGLGTQVSMGGHPARQRPCARREPGRERRGGSRPRTGPAEAVRRQAPDHVHSLVVGLHQPSHRAHSVHSVGCGRLGEPQRVVAQLVEHWSPKPAVGGSSPSGPATHTFARLCAHVRTSMHRRAAPPGAARPRPGIR